MIIDLTKSSVLEITSVGSEQQPSRMCRSLWTCGGCSLVFDPSEGCCPRCGHSVCPPEYEEFNWDAYREWKEFRKARVSQEDADSVPAWIVRVRVVKAALFNEHMRTVLKQCIRRAIRPEVVKIIDNLEPIEAMSGSHCVESEAIRIVDLDDQERSRREFEREAEHD